MHVLLEGVLFWEIKLLLTHLIFNKLYFSIDFMNDRFANFTYGSSEVENKPPKLIEKKHIQSDNKLPLSGNI